MGFAHIASVVLLDHGDNAPASEILDSVPIDARPLGKRAEAASEVVQSAVGNPCQRDKLPIDL